MNIKKFLERGALSRRNLLKSFGGGIAVAAFPGCSKDDDGDALIFETADSNPPSVLPEKTFKGACRPNCWNSCMLDVTVRGDKVVRTKRARLGTDETGLNGLNEEGYYDRICLRGLSHVQRMYSPDRVYYPLKRMDDRERGDLNGFKRISWQEAMNTISGKFHEIISAYGSRAVAFITGSQAYGETTGVGPYGRLASSLNASSIASNVDMALTLGLHRVFGPDRFPFFDSNELSDMPNAQTIFVWGSNISETQVQSWHFLADALDEDKRRKIGKTGRATMVAIDPMFTVAASKADYYVSPRPGSDTVIVLAMLREIMHVRREWTDWEYLFNDTVAPFLIREDTKDFLKQSDITGSDSDNGYVGLTIDGSFSYTSPNEKGKPVFSGTYSDYDQEGDNISVSLANGGAVNVSTAYALLKNHVAEWTYDKCMEYANVNEETLKKLTELFAAPENKPVTVYPGFGTDHYSNGHHFAHALATLSCITGNVGKPGASCGLFIPFGFVLNTVPLASGGASSNIPYLQWRDVMDTGKFRGEDYPIKGLWMAGGNQISNMGDQKQNFIDGIIPKLDFIVCSEVVMTDSARYADIILPAAYWFEAPDIVAKANHPFAVINEKAVEPVGGAVSDWKITQLFAQAMDKNGAYNIYRDFAYTEEEYLAERLKGSVDYKGDPITYERLKEEKSIRYLSNLAKNGPFIFGEDGIYKGNATMRAEFYANNMNLMMLTLYYMNLGRDFTEEERAFERLPSWEKPIEAWDGPGKDDALTAKYPLAYQQEHTRWRVHSQWFHVEWLMELAGEPFVMINPQDAGDIKTGDMVKVYNDRGYALVKARVTEKMRPGQVSIPKGYQRSQFKGGGYQELTTVKYHPAAVNQAFYDARVKIEKADI